MRIGTSLPGRRIPEPGLDSRLAHQVVDVNRALPEAIDPADTLPQDRGVPGSSMLMQPLAARCRLRPTPPASVAKSTRHAGPSWKSVRRAPPSAPQSSRWEFACRFAPATARAPRAARAGPCRWPNGSAACQGSGAPPISVLPSTGVVCHAARRHFGSRARSSTHSTIDASSASLFHHRCARQHETVQ